jgi:hypothetical protein
MRTQDLALAVLAVLLVALVGIEGMDLMNNNGNKGGFAMAPPQQGQPMSPSDVGQMSHEDAVNYSGDRGTLIGSHAMEGQGAPVMAPGETSDLIERMYQEQAGQPQAQQMAPEMSHDEQMAALRSLLLGEAAPERPSLSQQLSRFDFGVNR